MSWNFGLESFDEVIARRKDHRHLLNGAGNSAEVDVAAKLRSCKKEQRCTSGACPVCLRRYRRLLLRETKVLFAVHAEWTRVSIIPAGLQAKAGQLSKVNLDLVVKRFRKRLERSPDLKKAVVYGGVDFSFNVEENDLTKAHWQGHFYILVARPRSRALRQAVEKAFPPEPTAHRPYRYRPVTEGPAAVTYVFKSVFNRRSKYYKNGEPKTRKLPLKNAEQRELLVYLDSYPLGARLFLRGIRRNGQKLQKIPDRATAHQV